MFYQYTEFKTPNSTSLLKYHIDNDYGSNDITTTTTRKTESVDKITMYLWILFCIFIVL